MATPIRISLELTHGNSASAGVDTFAKSLGAAISKEIESAITATLRRALSNALSMISQVGRGAGGISGTRPGTWNPAYGGGALREAGFGQPSARSGFIGAEMDVNQRIAQQQFEQQQRNEQSRRMLRQQAIQKQQLEAQRRQDLMLWGQQQEYMRQFEVNSSPTAMNMLGAELGAVRDVSRMGYSSQYAQAEVSRRMKVRAQQQALYNRLQAQAQAGAGAQLGRIHDWSDYLSGGGVSPGMGIAAELAAARAGSAGSMSRAGVLAQQQAMYSNLQAQAMAGASGKLGRIYDWSNYLGGGGVSQGMGMAELAMARSGNAGNQYRAGVLAQQQGLYNSLRAQAIADAPGKLGRIYDWSNYLGGGGVSTMGGMSLSQELAAARAGNEGNQYRNAVRAQQQSQFSAAGAFYGSQMAGARGANDSRFLSRGGYGAVGDYMMGGEHVTDYRNRFGSTARLNNATGVMTQNESALDRFQQKWSAFSGVVGKLGPVLHGAFAPLRAAASFASGLLRTITYLSVTMYSLTRLGRLGYDAATGPYRAVVGATEDSRRFEYGISGVSGGLGQAQAINRGLVLGSQNSPLTVAQLRESAEALAATPALVNRIGLGSAQQVGSNINQFASVSGRLQTLFPEQGATGVLAGVRNALQGDFQSTRRRFGLSPELLSQLAGTDISELRNDPTKTLGAIEKFVDLFIPPEAFEQTSRLVSVRWQKLKDAVNFALAQVGDSGVFDALGNKLKSISDQMFSYFGGEKFQKEGKRISDSMEKVLGNVARAGNRLLDALTGKPNDISSVEGTVNAIGNVFDRIAGLSERLPAAVDKIGPAITSFTAHLGRFFDAVIAIGRAIENPSAYAKSKASGAAASVALGVNSYTPGGITQDAIANWMRGPTVAANPFALAGTTSLGSAALAAASGIVPGGAASAGSLAGIPDIGGGNFGSLFFNLGQSLNGVSGGGTGGYDDAFSSYTGTLRGVMGNLPGSYQQIQNSFDSRYGARAARYAKRSPASFFGNGRRDWGASQLWADITEGGGIQDPAARFGQQRDLFAQQLRDSVADVVSQISDMIRDAPDSARAQIMATLINGQNEYARGAAGMLSQMGVRGLDNLPQPLRTRLLGGEMSAARGVAETNARYGFMDDRSTRKSLRDVYSSRLGGLQANAASAEAAFYKSPGQDTLVEMHRANDLVRETTYNIDLLDNQLDEAKKSFDEFGASVRNSLEQSLGSAINNLITGVGSLSDVLSSLAGDITQAFSRMASQNILNGLIGNLGQVQANGNLGNGAGSLFGGLLGLFGGGGTPGVSTNTSGIMDVTGGNLLFRANGGYTPGRRATVVGENGPELFIPHGGGTIIPGGGGFNSMPSSSYGQENRTYIVVGSENEAFVRGMIKNKHHLVTLVHSDSDFQKAIRG